MDNSEELFDVGEEDSSRRADTYFAKVPAYAFIIDCSQQMHLKNKDEDESNFIVTSLQAISGALRQHIFDRRRCYVSIILMATDKSINALNVKNIVVLSPLQLAGASVMQELAKAEKLAKTDSFERMYGVGNFCLSEALWIASTLLQERKAKLLKKIVLFTNCSDPFPKAQDRVRIYTKMADFSSSKISFYLVPLGDKFDPGPYKELLELCGGGECRGGVSTPDQAQAIFTTHVTPRTPRANIKFFITDDVSIPVSYSTLASRSYMPTSIALSAQTNDIVESKTVNKVMRVEMESDDPGDRDSSTTTITSLPVDPSRFLRCQTVSGKTIAFTPTEMEEIDSYGAKELRLVGFKPKNHLQMELHIKPCQLIYPSETVAKGCGKLFGGLVERCEAKDVVAVCRFCPGKHYTSRYVALVPCTKDIYGFLLVFLPFGDEVRDLDALAISANISQEKVDVMKKVVKKLKRSYSPAYFPNPKLASHWRAVEALALDLFEPEPVLDHAEPDYELLRERLGPLTQRVMDEVYEGNFQPSEASKSAAKMADPMADIAAVTDAYANDTMKSVNVGQLRSYLKSVGMTAGLSKLKKAELINVAVSHLSK